jgi:hypothetical protein
MPPHCPYLVTSQTGTAGALGAATTLVTKVVGTGSAGAGAAVGSGVPVAGALPVPSHTAGPGMGYVVAVMAAGLSMLNAMPGSVPV